MLLDCTFPCIEITGLSTKGDSIRRKLDRHHRKERFYLGVVKLCFLASYHHRSDCVYGLRIKLYHSSKDSFETVLLFEVYPPAAAAADADL
jgi:hypothetical protein